MEQNSNINRVKEFKQEPEETESRGLLGMIVTWAVWGLFFVGTVVGIIGYLSHSKLILVLEVTAAVMVLLFFMAKYIVYSAQKEKQKLEYLAKHNEPIR